VRFLIYDTEGNRAEKTIYVFVENGILNMRTWGPWILIIIGAIITGIVLFILAEKKGKPWVKKIQDLNAEKIRLKYIDKDQVIKRIEIIESEVNRPLILHCKYCKAWFYSSKNKYICPICERDQLYIGYNCINCGKWYFKDDPDEDFYCKNSKCAGVKLIKRELNEIKDILGNEGIFLREYKLKKKGFSILD
jgi:hypothetical protein